MTENVQIQTGELYMVKTEEKNRNEKKKKMILITEKN